MGIEFHLAAGLRALPYRVFRSREQSCIMRNAMNALVSRNCGFLAILILVVALDVSPSIAQPVVPWERPGSVTSNCPRTDRARWNARADIQDKRIAIQQSVSQLIAGAPANRKFEVACGPQVLGQMQSYAQLSTSLAGLFGDCPTQAQGLIERASQAQNYIAECSSASRPRSRNGCPEEPSSDIESRTEGFGEYEVVVITHSCPFSVRFIYVNSQLNPRKDQQLRTSCVGPGKKIVGARSSSTSMQKLTAKPVWEQCGQ